MKKLLISGLLLLTALIAPAQSIAVTDSGVQLRRTVWKTHNPTDGSQIGGVQPTSYFLSAEVPGDPTGMQLEVEGASWSTMMAYTQRPLYFVQPDYVQLDFDATILDPNGALLETDMMVVVPVPNTSPQTYTLFNMSLQDLFSTGDLMNVNGGGSWLNIPGAVPGKLAVGTHHYTITGGWNLSTNTYGLTAVTIDGTTYPVKQSSTGRASTWSPGVSIQFQISNAPLASGSTWGSTSVLIDNVVLQQVSK
jgi:hypothetical protein